MKQNTNAAFRTEEELQSATEDADADQIEDEEEQAVFNHKARQRERRRAAEDKVQARLNQ